MNSGWRGPGDVTLIAGRYGTRRLNNVRWIVGVRCPDRVGRGGWVRVGPTRWLERVGPMGWLEWLWPDRVGRVVGTRRTDRAGRGSWLDMVGSWCSSAR
jgi:hypothetical protein